MTGMLVHFVTADGALFLDVGEDGNRSGIVNHLSKITDLFPINITDY